MESDDAHVNTQDNQSDDSTPDKEELTTQNSIESNSSSDFIAIDKTDLDLEF
ncbi:hypothetical protein I4U23_002767 [Adineta vaga]|nr:hypothetical protein I4U23_002767 [Adineta vaga]